MAFVFDSEQWWKADAVRQEREDRARQQAMVSDYQNASMRLYNEEVRRRNALAGQVRPAVVAPTRNALAAEMGLPGSGQLDSVGGDPGLPPRGWRMGTALRPNAMGLATTAPRGTLGVFPTEGLPNYVPAEFRPSELTQEQRDQLLQRAQQTTKNAELPLTSQQQAEVLPEVRTWGEYQAAMQNAKQTMDFYSPLLEAASSNPEMMKAITTQIRKSPVALLHGIADVFDTVKADGEDRVATVDTTTPEGLAAARLVFGDLFSPGLKGVVRYNLVEGKPKNVKFTEDKTTAVEQKDTSGGVEITDQNLGRYQAMIDANPALKGRVLKVGDKYDFAFVDGKLRTVEPTKPPTAKATSFKTVVTVTPENRAGLEAASGEAYKDGTKLSVTKTDGAYTEIVPVKEEKPQTQTQAFVLSPESRAFLASKIRPGDAAARASLNSFKVDGKTEVTAEFDSDGFVRSIGKAGTAPGVSVSVKTPSPTDSALYAGTWDGTEGQFGARAANKPVFENQIILWMQALSKNPNARLFSAQGQRGAVLDSEAKQRVSDYMVSKGIPPEALVDAGAARSALPALKKQQANLEANAKVAEGGFARVKRLREQGGVSGSLSPLVNKAVNILRNWTGDEYPKAAQGVLTEVLMDYAKVISGQTSTAGVTAYAAKLAEGLLPLSDNPAQFERKLREYEGMMKTRLNSQRQVLNLLSKQAGMGGPGEPEDTGVHPWSHSVPPKAGMTLQGGKVVDEVFYNKKTRQYGVTYVR